MKNSELTPGQRVKIARTNAKLTQSELGAFINVKKAAIANIENGTNALSWAYAHILCEPLKVTEEWLLTGEGDMLMNSPNNSTNTHNYNNKQGNLKNLVEVGATNGVKKEVDSPIVVLLKEQILDLKMANEKLEIKLEKAEKKIEDSEARERATYEELLKIKAKI